MASGQLQKPGAYPMSCGYEYNLTFPTWRTIGDVAPVDGEQDRVTFPTWRTSGDVAPVDGDEEMAPVDVAADANPANNQSPEADGWSNDNVSLAPTDPKGPPISVGCAQSIEPTVVETIAQGWCESCVRGRGGCVRGRSRDDPHRRQDLEEGNPMPIVQCDYFSSKQRRRTSCARQSVQSIRYTTARWRWNVKQCRNSSGITSSLWGSRGPKCKETLKELSTTCWTAQSTDCPGGLGGSLFSRTNQHTDVWNASMQPWKG